MHISNSHFTFPCRASFGKLNPSKCVKTWFSARRHGGTPSAPALEQRTGASPRPTLSNALLTSAGAIHAEPTTRRRTWPDTAFGPSACHSPWLAVGPLPGHLNVLAAGRRAACGQGLARGGRLRRLAAQLDRLRPHTPLPHGHRGGVRARATAAVRARGARTSAREELVRDRSRGRRSCVWACSDGSGMSMRASPVHLWRAGGAGQRPVSAAATAS